MKSKESNHHYHPTMPKGNKLITTGYSTFHTCVCGYEIENASPSLIAMKKKLHRKKCEEWKKEDVTENNVGIVDLPPTATAFSVNRGRNAKDRLETMDINLVLKNKMVKDFLEGEGVSERNDQVRLIKAIRAIQESPQ
jgi:hypothetical protein